MKALETMPVKMMAVLIVLAIVVGVGFWQVNYFLNFNREKEFKQEVTKLAQAIDSLRSSGDYGTFTTVPVFIPNSYNLTINVDDIDKDVIMSGLNGPVFNITIGQNITDVNDGSAIIKDSIAYFGGNKKYNFILYYGNNLKDDQIREYTIVFK